MKFLVRHYTKTTLQLSISTLLEAYYYVMALLSVYCFVCTLCEPKI